MDASFPIDLDPLPPRESAVDACEHRLRAAILSGQIAPGDKLPTERQLSERFGVNRVTVRSALAHLAHAGLVSVRQGSGYLVRDYRRAGGPELLPALSNAAQGVSAHEVARDLLAVRRSIARVVLEALCDHMQPDGVERVSSAIDRFEALVDSGAPVDDIAHADLDVVAAIVDATGRPTLALCLNPISSVLEEFPALRAAMFADPSGNLAGWRALASWLRTRRRRDLDAIVGILAKRDEATIARIANPRRVAPSQSSRTRPPRRTPRTR